MYWSSERVIIYISSVCVCVCVCVCVQSFGPVQLFATPWTVAHQAPLAMEFFRQEYWSGLPVPSPRDLHDPGIEPKMLIPQIQLAVSEPFLCTHKSLCTFSSNSGVTFSVKSSLIPLLSQAPMSCFPVNYV